MLKGSVENIRFPHTVKVYRNENEDNPFERTSETVDKILYEGVSRNFTTSSSDGGKDVVENQRISSIPYILNDWQEEIIAGDLVEAANGVFTEWGTVKDVKPGNLGTDILWTYGRN